MITPARALIVAGIAAAFGVGLHLLHVAFAGHSITLRWRARVGADAISDAAWLPDSTAIAVVVGGRIELLDATTGKLRSTYAGDGAIIDRIAFDRKHRRLFSAEMLGATVAFDSATRAVVGRDRNPDQSSVSAMLVVPDTECVAVGYGDGGLAVLDARTGNARNRIEGDLNTIECLAYAPAARVLLAGCAKGDVKFWTLPGGKPAGSVAPGSSLVWALSVAADDRHVVLGTYSGSAVVIDATRRQIVKRVHVGYGPIRHVCLAHSGTRVVLAAGEALAILSFPAMAELSRFYLRSNRAAASPTSELVVACGRDAITVVDAKAGTDEPAVRSSCLDGTPVFSPDGTRLLVYGDNGEVEIWKVHERAAANAGASSH